MTISYIPPFLRTGSATANLTSARGIRQDRWTTTESLTQSPWRGTVLRFWGWASHEDRHMLKGESHNVLAGRGWAALVAWTRPHQIKVRHACHIVCHTEMCVVSMDPHPIDSSAFESGTAQDGEQSPTQPRKQRLTRTLRTDIEAYRICHWQ